MFSITAFYWGNEETLKKYVDHARKYTDDVVIGHIDLFGDMPKIDGAKIVPFDHRYLLNVGHSVLMTEIEKHCQYDWTLKLDVGKRISWFNNDFLISPPENIAGYSSKEKNNEKDKWHNFHSIKKAGWIKTVHESIIPNSGYILSPEPIVEWERIGQSEGYSWDKQYYFKDEKESIVCGAYRQLSRIKWVALEDIDPHPARDLAIEMYKTHRWAYELDRKDLINYLIDNNLEAGM